ncbi:ReoY family proteolytic degradation factor [Oceanobacillus luteolus]|uniref:UPF0302 protein ACFSBH_11825 n=1 Tax=Oceanobacillus luteolus TaxID=1274358 RepID=A0ABW4HT89_9BACI|nr:ReoY family proteolytic degradation factor [Oceanobacillus luteolus]MCM3738870.1 ReoY family proteolytic degradation factor [Oceanobacillus luteolus]
MRTPIIQPHEKKAFIYWFLNQYELKSRESNWILTYLASNHKVLRNVHFVRNAKFCPRSIVISSTCSDGVAFRFYRNQLVTSEPEKAFHDIRLNAEEPLYIELNFYRWKQSPQFALILEENPFLTNDDYITNEDKVEADRIINYTLQYRKKELLIKAIDQALDERDPEKFHKLSKELQQVEASLLNQPTST